jgi:hypothetical protein
MDHERILNKLAQINSLIESIKYIAELKSFLAPIIMSFGGNLYMDYPIIGTVLFLSGMYLLIWSFRSSLKILEKNLQIKIDKKIDIPEEIEFEQEFIPLKEAVDYFIEYNIRQSSTANHKLAFNIFSRAKYSPLNQELANLLGYFIDKEITIYGQKTKSISNLQAMNLEYINTRFLV